MSGFGMSWVVDVLLVQSPWSSCGCWRSLVRLLLATSILFSRRSMSRCALGRLGTRLIVGGGRRGRGGLPCIGISSNSASSTAICSPISSTPQHELEQSKDEQEGQNTPANPTECFDSLENSTDFVMTSAVFEIRKLSL